MEEQRQVDKATLEKFAGSISCGTIGEGKIKKPFEFDGNLYVGTSGASSHKTGYTLVEAYRVVPENEFAGKIYSYDEKRQLVETDEDRKTFYHGVRVRQGGNSYVLQLPKIKFVPSANQTKPKKAANVIEKPKKALREDLQKQKQAFEKKGWSFSQAADMSWGARIFRDGVLNEIGYFEKIFDLFQHIVGLEEIETKFAPPEETVKAEVIFSDTVIPIRISDIFPSGFEPQARRRARFKDDEIESLGESIAMHGLQQPVLVRPVRSENRNLYEIVFGERRFLAVQKRGIETINCFVRELTDAQVLELQYEENHRRQENNPLDDAFFFKFLMEKENYTSEELASRLNTSIANVQNKLILNDLIPAAVQELADGLLPLKHAYFLARFPVETQELICKEQYAYKYYDRTEKATSFKAFVEEVEENITRKLANAPFSTVDPRLRIDKLICPDCPQRTGYAPALFTDLSKDDSCLNKSCFELKTNVHLRLKRDEIALQLPNPAGLPIEEKVKEVPLVTDRVWTDKKPLGEKPLVGQKFHDEPQCEYDTPSLIVEGNLKGKSTFVCTEKDCAVHNPQPPEPDLTDAAFVRRVELLTREKVLAKSIGFFNDYQTFWLFDDLIQKLIFELWENTISDTRDSILRIIKDWKNLPKNRYTGEEIQNFIASLDKTKQSQLIFLLVHHTTGFYQNDNKEEIKKLADDYGLIDYRILEAEARLELAPESEKDLAQDILTITRAGVNDLRKPDFDLEAVH